MLATSEICTRGGSSGGSARVLDDLIILPSCLQPTLDSLLGTYSITRVPFPQIQAFFVL